MGKGWKVGWIRWCRILSVADGLWRKFVIRFYWLCVNSDVLWRLNMLIVWLLIFIHTIFWLASFCRPRSVCRFYPDVKCHCGIRTVMGAYSVRNLLWGSRMHLSSRPLRSFATRTCERYVQFQQTDGLHSFCHYSFPLLHIRVFDYLFLFILITKFCHERKSVSPVSVSTLNFAVVAFRFCPVQQLTDIVVRVAV